MRIHRTNTQEMWKRALGARRVARTGIRPENGGKWRFKLKLRAYFLKMKGMPHAAPEIYPVEIFWSFVGAFFGIGFLNWCDKLLYGDSGHLLLLATFGASAMLLFGAPQAAFSQPRNVVGGHVLSALVGILACRLLGPESLLAAPAAVATAIAVMHLTGTLHPPGGGTALLMVTGGPPIINLGFFAVLFPVGVGACMLVFTALITNNLSRRRRYPLHWW